MPSDATITLKGRVERITFHNPENGYTVARLEAPGGRGLITAVGSMPGVSEGQEVELTGREILHPKFGPQIEVESCRVMMPSDAEGVRRYLASGLVKGVGPVIAQRIVDTLGEGAVEAILADPEVLRRVPGIGGKKAGTISQSLADHGALREVMVFLRAHGVPTGTALRIWRRYGAGAMGVLREDPHRLAADIDGIGFATADAIAAKLGIADDHPGRLRAGILYTLRKAREEGHIFLPQPELFQSAARELAVPGEILEPALDALRSEGRVVVEEWSGEAGTVRAVFGSSMHLAETLAAEHLARISRQPGLLTPERAARAAQWVAGELAVAPSEAQGRALEALLTAGLAVLTGGPGTGKTTLVRALITIAGRMGATVALAAPTGRAARRLAEASGLPAQTLHRLLEFSPKENRFQRGEERPVEADVIVVDESSMIDIWLGANLAAAVGPGSRLILVGDADQLPPVGPGLFFRQIIESGAARVARLREIFRQKEAGLIIQNAHRINQGRLPLLPEGGGEADFFFLSEEDPAKAAGLVAELATRRLPDHYGLDPQTDIQVLAPMHRGVLGCRHLNQLLRAALNPSAGDNPEPAAGDKVMQQRNNYELEVFNGDVGRVEAVDEDGAKVGLEDRRVEYSRVEMSDLALAYAITVHKSQGSEYPAVIMALAREHFVMLNRPLLYTAVTRGKRLVILVGHWWAVKKAVESDEPARRFAALDRRIRALTG